MTDWTKDTGSYGQLIISDNGSTVSFRIKSTYPSTYAYGIGWSGTVNGKSVSGSFDIAGSQTVTLGSWSVSTSQTVSFTMNYTGTSGLGGPTSFSHAISRTPAKDPPSVVRSIAVSSITYNSAKITFTAPADNGGAGIDEYLIRFATHNPPNTQPYFNKTGNSGTVITGLAEDTTYYVVVYAHNSEGYSPIPTAVKFKSLPSTTAPSKPTAQAIDSVTSSSMRYDLNDPPNGGATITTRQAQYSVNSNFSN